MVTFIIPTINRPTLDNAINSLIAQTNPNWKAIVLFDGIEKRDFNDKRIISLSVTKKGSFGAKHGNAGLVRNLGIEQVDTEWIGFLDDDDTLENNYVELLLNKYQNYDLVVFRMIWNNGRIIPVLDSQIIRLNDVGISFAYKSKYKNEFINSDSEDFNFVYKLSHMVENYIITPEITYNVRA